MKNRYTFPILDVDKKLVGVSGRYIYPIKKDSKIPKWKHIGEKSKWQYPAYFNSHIIEEKSCAIIVESIGDMLALWEAGIKNVIVNFGLNVSFAIINTLIKHDVEKIVLSLNNDENLAGNQAAQKAHKKLLKFFDRDQIQICFPTKNDFGEMQKGEIQRWEKTIK
jgi:DNA primase